MIFMVDQYALVRFNTSLGVFLLALVLLMASMYNSSLQYYPTTIVLTSKHTHQNVPELENSRLHVKTLQHTIHSEKFISIPQEPASVLDGCGQICEMDIPGIPSLFFNFTKKVLNCPVLWTNQEIDMSRIDPPTPLIELSSDFLGDLTYNGKVSIFPYMALMDQKYLGGDASLPIWEAETINTWAMQCAGGTLEGNYGKSETSFLLQGLLQVPLMDTARVLVIGSENPWVEACILAAGATDITTLEYGRIDSRHPNVKTITPEQMRERYSEFSEWFDVIVTFSSVEHAGLGRYGDRLNPWGDRQAIARAWCATKPGGYLVIGVPYGRDAIEYNAHRIYGDIMYPHLVANWYQQWRAEAGDQRVHVLRKSVDGSHDPGHVPPDKAFCLVGSLYGRSNNQILAIGWALMLARRQNLKLVLTTSDGPGYLFTNWASTFGNAYGIRWGRGDSTEVCEQTMSWHDSFHEMLAHKRSVNYTDWPLIIPLASIRATAQLLWTEKTRDNGSFMTVHGRSFEYTGQCLSTEHSGYSCDGEQMCDYSLHTMLDRFKPYLNDTVDPSQIVLFTDGQNQDYDREYPVVEREGNLFVHMWMMALSPIHIGNPGSSMDYVIWRWRQYLQNENNGGGIMLPWMCYANTHWGLATV